MVSTLITEKGVEKVIIIGEKINGAVPKTGKAIAEKDEAYIIELVKTQVEAGSHYLDVCAGTPPEIEYDTLCWLIDIVQAHTEIPICIDSPDVHMLEKVFPRIKRPGIINSISGEGNKCDVLLPLLKDNSDWQVVALCCDNGGMAESAEDKIRMGMDLINEAAKYGVTPDRIHIDPLVLALSAVNDASLQFCKAITELKQKSPTVKIAAALSNVSFGMPARALLNRNFLTLIIAAGLDTIIADPTNRDIAGNIFATQALLGKDKHCRKYNNAFRSGKIGPVKK
jgi:5-methyltetrahydrofolate--homocysteine methyltransferase